jgi:chromosome segregation ATPase
MDIEQYADQTALITTLQAELAELRERFARVEWARDQYIERYTETLERLKQVQSDGNESEGRR